MLLHAVADRLHDVPAIPARHIDKAFDAQHVVFADHRGEPDTESGEIGDRPAIDDKALEIVVIVLALDLVQ